MVARIRNAWICRIKGDGIKPVFGDLELEDGIIKSIQRKSFKEYLRTKFRQEKNTLNAAGKVLTIPNINFHEHIYSRLAKGLPVTGKTDNFYRILDNIWWKLDRSLDHKMTKASAAMAAIESIKNGVTYLFDHHASPLNAKGSLDAIARVLQHFNLRSVLTHETSDRNGEQYTEESIEENIEFYLKNNNADTKSLFGLHAPFTLKDSTLNRVQKLINDHNIGIHIHLSEDQTDRVICEKLYGSDPLSRLVKYKLLNSKSILAHSVHLEKNDYKKIVKYNSAVAVNIDSNLNNSIGIHNFKDIPHDLIFICGTDGMHANPVRTLKNIFLLMRHSGMSSENSFDRIKQIYLNQVIFVKRFFPDFGTLNKGDRADFIIWDYTPPTPVNEDNFWGHYIYGVTESQVNTVVQAGKFLSKNKNLPEINEEEINKNIRRQGNRLYKQFQKQ